MVVVDAQYVEPYVVDLAVQRKSGVNPNASFTVVDVNGTLMFNIKDTRFSFHDRHILYDAIDKPVLTFKKKLRSIHGRWQAFKGESTTHKDLLFSVKKTSAPKHETELDVFLVENKEETVCDCKVMGNWETKSCTIYAQDCSTILAEVHDMQSNTGDVVGKDTFGITVYPDVDYVFIVALVVILTEIKTYDGSSKKKKKKKSKSIKKIKSDSSDDDSKEVMEKKEVMENLEVKEDEEDDKEEEYEDDEEDDDDDDDYDEEDHDYGDENYEEEPKYDEYDDDDEEESSSDEDDSPK